MAIHFGDTNAGDETRTEIAVNPPTVCPPPPDCPLYAQRVDYGTDESLRRAVLMERRKGSDLAALVHAEAAVEPTRPAPTLPPAPVPVGVPNLNAQNQKGIRS